MDFTKTIICDIDDTISFTTERDWENAEPNIELIEKLNKLYLQGWEIDYYTARGFISFKGDRQEAEKYYRPIIENWFKKHNVLYSTISFNKPLASYYIDDKGITPEDFLNLEISVLEGGLSGAFIEKRGNRVFKTSQKSLEEAFWYKEASKFIETVKVHNVIGKTICLEYIQKTEEPKVYQIEDILNIFRNIPIDYPIETYLFNLETHLENEIFLKTKEKTLELFYSIKTVLEEEKSFCHGDFTLDNMINRNGTLYLIDPNFKKEFYSSWLLDVSKLLQSCKRFKEKILYDYFLKKYKNYKRVLLILELTHWVRMYKYCKDDLLKETVLEEVENLIFQLGENLV